MEEAKPHFFKVMIGDFNNRLEIPKAFLNNISQISSEMANLEGPGGSSWRVRLNRTSDGLYLGDGWRIFSRAHSLSFGEFLLFRYNGNANFSVQIFGTSTIEKRDGFAVLNSQEVINCEGKKRRGRPPKNVDNKVYETPGTTLKPWQLTENAEHQHEDCIHEPRTLQFDQSKAHEGEHGTSSDDGANRIFEVLDPKPSFTVTMQQSFKIYLQIPSWFTEKHFTRNIECVTLVVPDGRAWSVGCFNDRGYYRLTRGWCNFRTNMNLREGDVCVFELVDDKNVSLEVRVLKDA